MKIYTIPEKIKGIIFDLDMTLYHDPEYFSSQTRLLVEKLGEVLETPYREMISIVDNYRNGELQKTGTKPSLGNTFLHFGITIQENVSWREQLFSPEHYFTEDEQLKNMLTRMSKKFRMVILTNNPSEIARSTMTALGCGGTIETVIGLDHTMRSKPDPECFKQAYDALGENPAECVSIGDRYGIDIAFPLSMGSGGILVEEPGDIYQVEQALNLT